MTPLPDHAPDLDSGIHSGVERSPSGNDATRVVSAQPTASGGPGHEANAFALSVGHDFGSRYHIIRVLGRGGMGAVYQAWDKVLEVAVAVKVIRPEATLDKKEAVALERRFKRELLLARQVTHRNVVRIHDLGEVNGITYITMPYIHGSDLATLLARDGAMSVERTLHIAAQVASGLEAAHEAGVVHRDLKPANIMVDADDDALIMDFGIARSTSSATGFAMTAAGAVVGTLEYMAPEQAQGATVDQRADIYSFGLIVYDVLLGRRRAGATSSVAELMQRMQSAPPPLRSADASIPIWLESVVAKCLQPDPAARYQTMSEVTAALTSHVAPVAAGTRPSAALPMTGATAIPQTPPVPVTVQPRRWQRSALVAAVVLAVTGGGAWWFVRDRPPAASLTTAPAATTPSVSVAVLPFRNASGDPTLDWLGNNISQVLGTMLGQSQQVRMVPTDRLHQVLRDMRIVPTAMMAPTELSRVADLTNAGRVLWGQYSRFGDAVRIDATLQDLEKNVSVPLNAMAASEAGLLTAIDALAGLVRQELARGSPDILSELKSTAWKPSTGSLDALRMYNEGVQLTRQGTHQAALKHYTAATAADPNFALGLSALAQTHMALGYDNEAAQFSRRAMSLSEDLPPQEKYLIAANHYRIVGDTAKAIESFENLSRATPNSAAVQYELATLYEQTGSLDKAREQLTTVVTLDPKYVEGLLALGRVHIRRGAPQDSLDPLNRALTLAIDVNNEEARGNVLQATGIAYKALSRPEEALRRYEEALAIRRKLDNKRGMAGSLGEIAQIQTLVGKTREAEESYNAALALQREIGDRSGTSITLINLASLLNDNLGRSDAALALLREALQLRRAAGNPGGEATVLNNIGSVYLTKGELSEAQTNFERALEIREKTKIPRELADTLHNLGETFSRMGDYEKSLARYHQALERRREAGDTRGAAIESYSIGTLFDYLGRYGAAVQSKNEALAAFRELKIRNMWWAEILSGAGNSLNLSGRLEEGGKLLEEAMTAARELQNPNLIAQTLRFQSERAYYRGDMESAARIADQAVQAATKSADRSLSLLAQAHLAKVSAARQPTRVAAGRLATLAQDADRLGLKAVAVECSLQRAETLLAVDDRSAARQEIDRALAVAETSGFRPLLARAHFLRGEVLRDTGDSEARRDYARALRIINDISAEDGSRDVLKRADVSKMHGEATRWVKGGE